METPGTLGSGTEPLNIIDNTGVQATTAPGGSANTTAIGKPTAACNTSPIPANGCQYGFATAQVVVGGTPLADDKSGKDDNFRGITIFGSTIYVSKSSGSNGIDTVYQVGTPGTLPTLATGATTPISVLTGFPLAIAKTAGQNNTYPFDMWFANATTMYVADEGSGATPSDATDNSTGGLAEMDFRRHLQWNLAYVLQTGLGPVGTPYSRSPRTRFVAQPVSPLRLRHVTGRLNDDAQRHLFGRLPPRPAPTPIRARIPTNSTRSPTR